MPADAEVMTASVRQRVDLGDGADERGLADAEAAGHHDLRGDRAHGSVRLPVLQASSLRPRPTLRRGVRAGEVH